MLGRITAIELCKARALELAAASVGFVVEDANVGNNVEVKRHVEQEDEITRGILSKSSKSHGSLKAVLKSRGFHDAHSK